MARMTLKGLFKVLFALRNTGRRGRDLAAEIQGGTRFVFLKNCSKGFNVSDKLCNLLSVIKSTPGRHRGPVQPVVDAAENILIPRHLVAIGRFMVRAKLVNPGREIPRFGVHDRGGDTFAVAIVPVTVL